MLLFVINMRDKCILFIIMWMYLYNFFLGQMWVYDLQVVKIINPSYYIFILLIFEYKKFHIINKYDKYLAIWTVCYLVVQSFGALIHGQFGIGIILYPYGIYIYYILVYAPHMSQFTNKLVNLLIAIGLMQVLLSFMQAYGVISRPLVFQDLYVSVSAGIDDAASGTMGTGQSNVTSWICTVLFIFFLSLGFIKKKKIYIILSLIFLAQYASVDSKTALMITLYSVIILLYKISRLKISYRKYIGTILMILLFGILLYSMINTFYMNISDEGIEYSKEAISVTAVQIIADIQNWGKVAGFSNLTGMLLNDNPIYILFGYGRGNYTYLDRRKEIMDLDTPIMMLNNATNSNSSFLSEYGSGGLFGLIMVVSLLMILYNSVKKQRYVTDIGKSYLISGKVMIIGSAIFMFVYNGHRIMDLAFTLILILKAVVIRYENEAMHKREYGEINK